MTSEAIGTSRGPMFATARGAVPLPPQWSPHLRPCAPPWALGALIEVSTLPSALALGAPSKVWIAVRYDESKRALIALGVASDTGIVPFDQLHTPWAAFWLETLSEAFEREIRRRRVTRPIRGL